MTADDLIQMAREGRAREFYNTALWRRKAKQALKRGNYECRQCRERKRYRRAECVHHAKELKDYPELALSDGNLVPLCKRCHNEIHGKLEGVNAAKMAEPVTPERW